MNKDNYGKKRLGKSYKQTVIEILDIERNPRAVHASNIMNLNQNEAITFLADQIDLLWTVVKAYKTGKL